MFYKRLNGFTLIEIIIVTAIVGIISVIAVPNYLSSVKKSYRIDAQLTMQKIALSVERFYTMHGQLTGGTKEYSIAENYGNACLPAINSCSETNGDIRYFFTIDLEADFYTITATPKNNQLDEMCGTLSLDMTNTKTIDNHASDVSVEDCW